MMVTRADSGAAKSCWSDRPRGARVLAGGGSPFAAAALQFSTRDPRIATTVVGAHTAEHVQEFVADSRLEIADSLFEELGSMTPPGGVSQDSPGSTWPR